MGFLSSLYFCKLDIFCALHVVVDVALISRTLLIDVITKESRTSRDHGSWRGWWQWFDWVDECSNVLLFMNGRLRWVAYLHWFEDTTTCLIAIFGPLKSDRVRSVVRVKIVYLFIYVPTHRSRKCSEWVWQNGTLCVQRRFLKIMFCVEMKKGFLLFKQICSIYFMTREKESLQKYVVHIYK